MGLTIRLPDVNRNASYQWQCLQCKQCVTFSIGKNECHLIHELCEKTDFLYLCDEKTS